MLGGGDGAGEEACGRRRRGARVILCIHCIFPGCSLQGVNLASPALDGGCWGEEPGQVPHVSKLFSRHKLQDPSPGAGAGWMLCGK